ncbi:MAG TPA: response regulator [Anaeromyxobacteraceae bacterium]|nr:response regulator [Anaeromyxobacteraceae bacterium]
MRRVLIVDDDDAIRSGLAEVLADEGYAVTEARDGQVGLREAKSNPPHLILLDLMMPTMTGWDFMAAQNRDPALAQIPVIIMSAFADDGPESLPEVAAHLAKPFRIPVLLEVVQQHASNKA